MSMIISKSAHGISKMGMNKFLAYLECIRSYAWSFGHSDSDLSSVSAHKSLCKVVEEKVL